MQILENQEDISFFNKSFKYLINKMMTFQSFLLFMQKYSK